jgi:hypothetical protein
VESCNQGAIVLTFWYPIEQLWQLPQVEIDEERRSADNTRLPGLLSTHSSAIGLVAASIATVGVVVMVLLTSTTNDARPAAGTGTRSPTAVPNSTAAQSKPVTGHTAKPTAPAPTPAIAIDNRGFVNSKARCEGTQSAVAIGRTMRSLVVVCKLPNGTYEYNGVRLSDGATLTLKDVRATPAGFEAHNEGATYAVSSKELVATSGDAILARDAMIEYRVPSPAH